MLQRDGAFDRIGLVAARIAIKTRITKNGGMEIMFMKKTILLLTGMALIAGFSTQAQIIADWTFETSQPTAGPYSPEIGAGSIIGSHSGTTAYTSPAGNGSSHSYSSVNWNVGDYYQIEVSTLGMDHIALSFAQTSSGTGPASFLVRYSTDGINFSTATAYTVLDNGSPNAAWTSGTPVPAYVNTYNLSGLTSQASDNDATLYLRFVDYSNATDAAGTAAVGAGGTDRMDNIIVAEIPEPSMLALFGVGGTFCLGFLPRGKKS